MNQRGILNRLKKEHIWQSILIIRTKSFVLLKYFCIFVIFWTCIYYCLKTETKFRKELITSLNSTPIKDHFLIYSTFYYNVSKLYSPNSMVILLNTHQEINLKNLKFECFSKNETANSSISTPLQIRMTNADPATNCQWEVFIANCSTVTNPTFFGITTQNASDIINLDFESPISDNLPVVMCYAPMSYEARWQQLIFATEIYHHFGIDLQIQYVNSAMKQIMEILKIYEKKKWIKIQEFAYYDFDKAMIKDIGFHPLKEIISRNQHLALADCLMRYREASDYIIIADIDEILFPKQKNYYTEFLKWNIKYPNSAAYIYPRSYAKIDTPNEFQNFSLSTAIKSFKISDGVFMGKMVLRTDKVETPWIHWPGISDTTPVYLNSSEGIIYHVQIAAEKIRAVSNFHSLGEKEDLINLKSFAPLSLKEIKKMEKNFVSSFENFTNFQSNWIYANILFDCFKQSEKWNRDFCYTPFRCNIPNNVTNFECETVQRNISVKILNKNSVFYIPKSDYFWIKNKDNCKIFN